MATNGGESNDYYGQGRQSQYPMQDQGGYQQNQNGYQQAPPNYSQGNGQKFGAQGNLDSKQDFNQAFKIDRPKWNDLWAGILLILTFFGFVVVSGLSLRGYSTNHNFNGGGVYDGADDFALNTNTIILFAFILVVALVFSWGYFTMARAFTKQFVWITGILNVVLGFATAIYYLYRKQYSAGIVFLLFAIFSIICFISWIPRIPFSVLMLQMTMDVAKKHGHVFTVSAIGGLIAFVGFLLLWWRYMLNISPLALAGPALLIQRAHRAAVARMQR
ncbi:putative choline transporter, neither null mutation nor overexpression affects choline transport [Lambiella insularis]|nr:putative choline transporter, neither null mutation nor overexpression affects choline transport [Lambiella insularis]